MATLQRQARALGDPTRHEIFTYVVSAPDPVDVAELTEHLQLNHNAIRQHLAKLVDADLVVESKRPPTGPGRPKLVYAIAPATESRWGVTGPYERLSVLLTEIIRTGDTPVEVGRREGRRQWSGSGGPGREQTLSEVCDVMAREGFEPEIRRRGARVDVVLHNCPFQSTALADPDTVCALHLGIAEGLAEGAETVVVDDLVAKDPRRANCRLKLHIEPPLPPTTGAT